MIHCERDSYGPYGVFEDANEETVMVALRRDEYGNKAVRLGRVMSGGAFFLTRGQALELSATLAYFGNTGALFSPVDALNLKEEEEETDR